MSEMEHAHVESGGIDLAMAPRFEDVAVGAIQNSPTNPRKHFAQPALEELADSMRTHGLAQPILLRPVDGERRGGPAYEIVAGERRWRAAMLLAWPTIPALVRNLSDQQTLELQVVENLQRADLHPLEEADGYERLIQQHGYDVESLAEKIGKSTAYIYATLKLSALVPEARTAFLDGKLNRSTALLVARMVPAVQSAAVAEVTTGDEGHPLSVRRTQDLLKSRFMLDLRVAVFDTEDPKLYPEAGPCTTCPKRTGNQHQLFADVSNSDTCTDPTCFNDKKARHWTRERERAAKAGRDVITGDAAKAIVPQYYGPHFQHLENDYTPVDAFVTALVENGLEERVAKQTFNEILRKAKVKPAAIETRDGSLLSALSKKQTEAIDRDFDKATGKTRPTKDDQAAKERDKRFARAAAERAAQVAFGAALREQTMAAALQVPPTQIEFLRLMVCGFWLAMDRIGGDPMPGLTRLGVTMPAEYSNADEYRLVRAAIDGASPDDLCLLLLEFTLVTAGELYWDDTDIQGAIEREVAEMYGVDHQALRKQLVDDVLDPPKKRTKAPAAVADSIAAPQESSRWTDNQALSTAPEGGA